jgi:lipid-binding SYLF domain-containing protein
VSSQFHVSEDIMFNPSFRPAALLLTCAYVVIAGCASPKTHDDARATAESAQTTLNDFMRDPQMTWLQRNISKAKAVLVSPRIWQAGFIVGGSGGNCVVSGRSTHGWTGPAFYKLGTGSVGLQAGAEATEMVALIMTDKAFNSLLSTSFKLGGDVSIAAGPVGAGAGAEVTADMVIFTRNKGLYGGLNVSGMVVSVDDKGNDAYYGRAASPVDILVKHSVSNQIGNDFARAIARTEGEAHAR